MSEAQDRIAEIKRKTEEKRKLLVVHESLKVNEHFIRNKCREPAAAPWPVKIAAPSNAKIVALAARRLHSRAPR